jgi:hypothetical protein
MNNDPDCCFAYVATGDGYVREAVHSGETLRRHHADIPIYLITDTPPAQIGPFTRVLQPDGAVEHSPFDKLLAYEAPHERIVFLDSDTHVLGDLTSIFSVLDKFDIAMLQEVSRGWDLDLPGVPLAFPEFNTGVIAFRKSAAMAQFFKDWRVNYAKFHEMLVKRGSPRNDQPSLRYTLFHSDLRVAALPSEYHFLGDYPNYIMWKALVIHGRGNYDRIARQVNEELGYRAYMPQIGVMTAYAGKRKLLSEWWRITKRVWRLVISGPENAYAKHPGNWWLARDKKAPEERG